MSTNIESMIAVLENICKIISYVGNFIKSLCKGTLFILSLFLPLSFIRTKFCDGWSNVMSIFLIWNVKKNLHITLETDEYYTNICASNSSPSDLLISFLDYNGIEESEKTCLIPDKVKGKISVFQKEFKKLPIFSEPTKITGFRHTETCVTDIRFVVADTIGFILVSELFSYNFATQKFTVRKDEKELERVAKSFQ